MTMTLNQAAKAAGKAKGTILKAINDGVLTAPKDEKNRYAIDPSELHRVFPLPVNDQFEKPILTTDTDHENRLEIAVLQTKLEMMQERLTEKDNQIADLSRRLDEEAADRRATQARLEDLRDKMTPVPVPAPTPERRGLLARLFG